MHLQQNRANRNHKKKERLALRRKTLKFKSKLNRVQMKRFRKHSDRRNSLALAHKLLAIAKTTSIRSNQRICQENKTSFCRRPTIYLGNKSNNNNNNISKHPEHADEDVDEDDDEDDHDDDDCILVEPTIDCITIDDENCFSSTPICNKTTKKRFVTEEEAGNLDMNAIYIEDTTGGFQINYPSYYCTVNTINLIDEKNVSVSSEEQRTSNSSPKRNADKRNSSVEIILIDDSKVEAEESKKNEKQTDPIITDSIPLVQNVSVEFVKEFQRSDNFIPLTDSNFETNVLQQQPLNNSKKNGKKEKSRHSLFTDSELQQLNIYNSNTYNPNGVKEPKSQKRMIIIDGSNVAFSYTLNKRFSVKGIKIVIEYFEKLGHEVKAVVPQYRLKYCKSTDPNEMQRLHNDGKIVLTPCKQLSGKSAASYDDRFILQLACELDAAILSNDNYQDLVHENSAFKKIIENRVIGYTWCNDIFILPKDPYGRWGPTLHSILNRY